MANADVFVDRAEVLPNQKYYSIEVSSRSTRVSVMKDHGPCKHVARNMPVVCIETETSFRKLLLGAVGQISRR